MGKWILLVVVVAAVLFFVKKSGLCGCGSKKEEGKDEKKTGCCK